MDCRYQWCAALFLSLGCSLVLGFSLFTFSSFLLCLPLHFLTPNTEKSPFLRSVFSHFSYFLFYFGKLCPRCLAFGFTFPSLVSVIGPNYAPTCFLFFVVV